MDGHVVVFGLPCGNGRSWMMADLNDFGYTDDVDDVLAVYVNNLLASTMRSEYKNVETLAADKTLTDADTPIQRLNCNGAARIVKVPTADGVDNHPFFIVNSSAGAYAITLKTNDAAAIIATISQGESVLVLPDGNGTYQLVGREREVAYKLLPTVASNNITLTLTHMDGTTPSTSRPLWFRIGDAWRAVTGALSVTVNAAVNTFNAGSAELATKEVDYFPYVSWRAASSAVVLGFSRIPYASLYSDFSGTATNEKYAAFSTAPASTDDVANIGRFAATLSAGAGYTWTVPTFTTANLINRPIFETRLLIYTPTWSSSGTAVSLGNSSIAGTYRISMRTALTRIEFTAGNTATFGTGVYLWTVPFTPVSNSYGVARILDSGTAHHTLTSDVLSAGNVLRGYPNNASSVGATSPMTWAASDELRAQIDLEI